MKTLILIRHAKSDWPENIDDFDRPLTEKGIENAEKMSIFIKNNNILIDKFISSPALRAVSTCEIFSRIFEKDFVTDKKLYNPLEDNFLSVIFNLEDSTDSVAMFSHNNGISNFANSISDNILMLPTCGVAVFKIDCDKWSLFEAANIKLLHFFKPKEVL